MSYLRENLVSLFPPKDERLCRSRSHWVIFSPIREHYKIGHPITGKLLTVTPITDELPEVELGVPVPVKGGQIVQEALRHLLSLRSLI